MSSYEELKVEFNALLQEEEETGRESDERTVRIHFVNDEILSLITSNPTFIFECGILDDYQFFRKVLRTSQVYYYSFSYGYFWELSQPELMKKVISLLYNIYINMNDERAKEPLSVACELLRPFTYPSGFFDDMKDDSKHWECLAMVYGIETYSRTHKGPVYNTDLEEVTRQSIRRFDNGDANQKFYIIRFWRSLLDNYETAIFKYSTNFRYRKEYEPPVYDQLSPFITAATLSMLPELFSKFCKYKMDEFEARICLYSLRRYLEELECEKLFPDMDRSHFLNDLQLLYEKWKADTSEYAYEIMVLLYSFENITIDEFEVLFSIIKDVLFNETTCTRMKSGIFVPYDDNASSSEERGHDNLAHALISFIEEHSYIKDILDKKMCNSMWYLMFMKYADGNREGFEWHTCLTSDDAMLRGMCLETIKPEELAQVPQFEEILVNSLKLAEEESNVFLSLATLEKCVKMKENISLRSQVPGHMFTHLESMLHTHGEEYAYRYEIYLGINALIKQLKPGWDVLKVFLPIQSFSSWPSIGMIRNIPSEEFHNGVADFVEFLLDKRTEVGIVLVVNILNQVLLLLLDVSLIEEFFPTLIKTLKELIASGSDMIMYKCISCLVCLSPMVPYRSDLYRIIFDTLSNVSLLPNFTDTNAKFNLLQALLKANDEVKGLFADWIISQTDNQKGCTEDTEGKYISTTGLSTFALLDISCLVLLYECIQKSGVLDWMLLTVEMIKNIYYVNEYVVVSERDGSNQVSERSIPINEAVIVSLLKEIVARRKNKEQERSRKLLLKKRHRVNGVSFEILNNGWQDMDRLLLDLTKWFYEMKDDREFNDICERLPEELKQILAELMV